MGPYYPPKITKESSFYYYTLMDLNRFDVFQSVVDIVLIESWCHGFLPLWYD